MTKTGFKDYKLDEELLKAISILGFEDPTKVQKKVIPTALKEKDIVVKSQTGSGKTAAFAIPVSQLVDWDKNKPQAIVITPTRELAIQVREDIFNIGRFKRLKVLPVYGKSPFYNQERELKQKTHVIVGTPGRIIDHIERGTLDTSAVKYLVIDEADEMFNMGFIDQLETIIENLPEERTTMLFSATMPGDIESLCDKHMKDPIYIDIEAESLTIDRIEQERYKVDEIDKLELLKDITVVENPDSCIVFCNTRDEVDRVYNELKRSNYTCDKIHGGMEQRDRLKVMEDFKEGYFRYLIATDVAARGIDVDNITHIINYDVPQEEESYVHRIGRTGRIDKTGRAITFVTDGEKRYLNNINRYIERDITLKQRPEKEIVNSFKEEFKEKMKERPKIEETEAEKLSREIMKLHINAGKKTRMRPTDIVGALCNIEGMTADDIGIINVIEVSTFVEILNDKGPMVLEELQTRPIKGRVRKVSIANR